MDAAAVERALAQTNPGIGGAAVLLSPAADPFLEEMARRAAALTRRRFGRVVHLYAPLYLSNECVNRCVYCGFAGNLAVPRRTLTPAEAVGEAAVLHEQGFRHLLLVSGEDPRAVTLPYLMEVVGRLRPRFHSLTVEIAPQDRVGYAALARAGVDGVALYQEAYAPEAYACFHPAGPKSSYRRRLEAIEAAGEAGLRSLGIGALLGLAQWRSEGAALIAHGLHLTRRFWRSRVAVSFPRIQPAAGGFQPPCPVADRDLVHLIAAVRLCLPDAEIVLSTRERAWLRDRLLPLGVTRVSAGSCTSPGGYTRPEPTAGEQFAVEDRRRPAEVAQAIAAHGLEPVWKDFDREFTAPSEG